MDPLSILASVIGLLTAAEKVSSVLRTITTNIRDAPRLAQSVLLEVNQVHIALNSFHGFLHRIGSAPRRRLAMIQLDHPIAMLTDLVLTFSELDAIVTKLNVAPDIRVWNRVKWAWKEEAISQILEPLQRQKSSLSLMMNIIQW